MKTLIGEVTVSPGEFKIGRIPVKRCTKCGVTKHLEEFNKHGKTRNGKQARKSQCRSCLGGTGIPGVIGLERRYSNEELYCIIFLHYKKGWGVNRLAELFHCGTRAINKYLEAYNEAT